MTGLLLGKGHLVRIPEEDEKLIEKLVDRLEETTFLVYSCKRIFLPCLGYNGQVLRTGEYVIFTDIQNNDEERVICIEEFISINCGFDYEIFCKGTQFLFVKNDSVERNFWTGYGHIKTNVSDSTTVYINPSDISRKVIVFHSDGTDVVIDFMRKKSRLHYDIVVPLHLLKDDMVLIQGSELADKWIGRIDKVDMATKTVKVYFYMETGNSIFVREIPGNTVQNTVLWRSVLSVCHGVWLNDKQWKKY